MRGLKAALAVLVTAAGLAVGSASPAEAAVPTCTSWSTYWAPYTTDYVTHVPSAGYQTYVVNCQLRRGNRNDAVKVLQRALKYCMFSEDLVVDGDFGPRTEAAVLEVQEWANGSFGAGIDEDGIYGPQTRNWTQFPDWTWPANQRISRCDHSPE